MLKLDFCSCKVHVLVPFLLMWLSEFENFLGNSRQFLEGAGYVIFFGSHFANWQLIS